MKVQLLHDRAGNIHGFLVHPPHRRGVLLPAGQDREITEVEIQELNFELTPESQDRTVEVMDSLLKEAKVRDGKLVRPKA